MGRGGVDVVEIVALALGVQALLEAVDTLEQCFEHICLGPSLLWHGVCAGTSAQVRERRSTSAIP
jgi:hypothetical protein